MSDKEDTQDHASEVSLNEKDDYCMEQSPPDDNESSNIKEELLKHLAENKAIFKSQQKEDPDLTYEEKLTIARNILEKSNCLFLSKFGHYLKVEHLKYFDTKKDEDYEVAYHINRLQRYFNSTTRQTDVKNRRFQALKTLVEKGEYFSECEMMKRNPLLYDQLIGQYMTEKQKKKRDNIDTQNITFVNLLMEKMDRDNLRKKQKLQEEEEQNALEESDTDEELNETCGPAEQSNPSEEKDSKWGRINKLEDAHSSDNTEKHKNSHSISKTEKHLLKQEFVSNMYQSFLDGKDSDFDYSAIDNNEAYDDIDLKSQDEEDKYFDSESPETVVAAEEPMDDKNELESEDELDMYINSLKVK